VSELRELASACIFPSFPGDVVPDWVKRFLADGGRGIVLFSYNVPSRERLSSLCAALRAERADVLLAIDEEGGDVTRLEWETGSSYPGGAALGAVDDVVLTQAVAVSIAGELAASGINWNLAPDADVNVPANPVIGTRAFGSDAAIVARHVGAFVRGTQSRGVAACAKHFPGHGATEQDSHLELPVVTGFVEAGLEPFRAAIAAGVRTIMTAHVRVPSLDEAPATLSGRIVQGLLRDELGYDGVVLADALEMKAVSETVGVAESGVQALAAGVDALCVGHDLGESSVEQIGAALAGEVPEARLREAAARIDALAAWARPSPGGIDRAVGRDAARRALVVEGDLAFSDAPVVVELRPRANIAAGEAVHSLASVVVREGEPVPAADVIVVRDAHRHPWMRQAADVPGIIVVETGLPVWRPRRSRGYIATNGGSRASYDAARELFGVEVTV
jgi:beta-N-acetylhexosaminidase